MFVVSGEIVLPNYVKNQPEVDAVTLLIILRFLVSVDINYVVCIEVINVSVIYHLEISEHK